MRDPRKIDPRKLFFGILRLVHLFVIYPNNASRIIRWNYLLQQIYDGDDQKLRRDVSSHSLLTQANPLGQKCLIAATLVLRDKNTLTDASGKTIAVNITHVKAISETQAVQEMSATIFAQLGRNKVVNADFPQSSQFWLDLLLPPDRAEQIRIALNDLYQRRWLPRYGPRTAKLICTVQIVGTIIEFRWIKFFALICGLPALRKFWAWWWG